MTVIESYFYVPMNIFQPNFVEMSVYLYKAPWKFQNTEFHSKQKKHNNDCWRGGSLHIMWSGILAAEALSSPQSRYSANAASISGTSSVGASSSS